MGDLVRGVIAALYVRAGGPYFSLEGVDPWGIERDARGYEGPAPVVAHPPCERWGRYWSGGPSARVRRTLGDDGGCFAHALASVRRWGGVLEHPEASHAWTAFGIPRPPRTGGWVQADRPDAWTCCVEQGHYGHRARKATWLLVYGYPEGPPPDLTWGPSQGLRMEDGFHTTAERHAARARGVRPVKRLSKRERIDTPLPFRDLLIDLARGAQ